MHLDASIDALKWFALNKILELPVLFDVDLIPQIIASVYSHFD